MSTNTSSVVGLISRFGLKSKTAASNLNATVVPNKPPGSPMQFDHIQPGSPLRHRAPLSPKDCNSPPSAMSPTSERKAKVVSRKPPPAVPQRKQSVSVLPESSLRSPTQTRTISSAMADSPSGRPKNPVSSMTMRGPMTPKATQGRTVSAVRIKSPSPSKTNAVIRRKALAKKLALSPQSRVRYNQRKVMRIYNAQRSTSSLVSRYESESGLSIFINPIYDPSRRPASVPLSFSTSSSEETVAASSESNNQTSSNDVAPNSVSFLSAKARSSTETLTSNLPSATEKMPDVPPPRPRVMPRNPSTSSSSSMLVQAVPVPTPAPAPVGSRPTQTQHLEASIALILQKQGNKKERTEALGELVDMFLNHLTHSRNSLIIDALLSTEPSFLLSFLSDLVCAETSESSSSLSDYPAHNGSNGNISTGGALNNNGGSSSNLFSTSSSSGSLRSSTSEKALLPLISRRDAADVMSSVVMKMNSRNSQALQDNFKVFVPRLVTLMTTEEDWAIRSNIVAIFSACNIEPSRYVVRESAADQLSQPDVSSCTPSSSSTSIPMTDHHSSYDYDNVSRIIQLLESKVPDVKESALNALMCMGPIAAEALPQIADILNRDRHPYTRIIALKVVEEIGFPHVLSIVDIVQDLARKDADKSVRRQAAQTLRNLRISSDNSDAPDDLVEGGSVSNGQQVLSSQNGGSSGSALPQSARQAQQVLTVQLVRDAVGAYCKVTGSTSVNAADLTKYIDSYYPQLTRSTGGRWKLQLKIALRKMTSKGTLLKTPASYSLPN